VPGYAIGARALSGPLDKRYLDTAMAVAVLSHLTFSFPADDELSTADAFEIRRWTDFYKQNRDSIASFTFPLLDDPATSLWTAMQPWNMDTSSGWVFAFRQLDAAGSTTVPLHGTIDAASYRVQQVDPAQNVSFPAQTFTGAQLRAGLPVSATANGYAIFRVTRV
ncbi:MAG: hypothetical protein ABR552_00065, partial [Actinomycetota bacterium]